MDLNELTAVSPIDGRYWKNVSRLAEYFSEFALIRYRVQVFLAYYQLQTNEKVSLNFSLKDAAEIKKQEDKIHHDIKAVEYWLQAKVKQPAKLHFGLTSEDVDSLVFGLALKEANNDLLAPTIGTLANRLDNLAKRWGGIVMLGRTHGQPAVPTTMGKELKNFAVRIEKILVKLKNYKFEAKLTGATGNFNALMAVDPKKDWLKFSDQFIVGFGLIPNHFTTQILPYDNWLEYFSFIKLLNNVLIGFCQDIWRYISDDYLVQILQKETVGSSTMPQKINPIDFENAEGNLGMANALIEYFERKLPISRLQRDLSDKTVKRNFGLALAHALLAYQNISAGLDKIALNEEKIRQDLDNHWEIIAEGVQTLLRAGGDKNAYEKIKDLTRGRKITKNDWERFLHKNKLKKLSPQSYVGLAEKLAKL